MSITRVSRSVVRFIWLAVICSFLGCSTNTLKGPPGRRIVLLPVAGNRQIIASENLHDWIVFSPASVTSAGRAQIASVSVPVRSVWQESGLNLQYRFVFSDSRGKPMRTEPGYRFIRLQPHTQNYLEGDPLDRGAMGWQLEIHAAR